MRKRFKLNKVQKELLYVVEDLQQSAIFEDHAGYYARANLMLRVADRLYNEIMVEKLVHDYATS